MMTNAGVTEMKMIRREQCSCYGSYRSKPRSNYKHKNDNEEIHETVSRTMLHLTSSKRILTSVSVEISCPSRLCQWHV